MKWRITTNNYILPKAKPAPLTYYQTFLILGLYQDYTMPHKVPLSGNEIKEEILWNDRYIKIGGKTVFCKSWVSKGILRIKDILNVHDNFLPFQDLEDTFDVRCSFLITVVFLQRFLKIGKMLSHMAIRHSRQVVFLKGKIIKINK